MTGRGGSRPGAGRKKAITKELHALIGQGLFDAFGGESKAWESLAQEARAKDLRLTFDILRYWTDRKYGKPVQQVTKAPEGAEKFGFGDDPRPDAVNNTAEVIQ